MAAADDSEVTNRCHAAADLIWEGRHDELEVSEWHAHILLLTSRCAVLSDTGTSIHAICHQASAAEGCERGDALSLLFVAEASFFRCDPRSTSVDIHRHRSYCDSRL